ncbi:hypothetical protein FB451DRAFT_1420333 [Mycena latifolia]|nr:hypothetical protein FB451DRAFT_1420333 [Mycena latifolia]
MSARDCLVLNEFIQLSLAIFKSGDIGETAFMGWKEFSKADKGETAFITSGAGLVGSYVNGHPLARRDGLKVLGREGPIEVYWDNMGGDVLDATLERPDINARFLECGFLRNDLRFRLSGAGYNTGCPPIKVLLRFSSLHGVESEPPQQNMHYTLFKSLTISGVMLLADGEIKYADDVSRPSHRLFLRVFAGDITGKAVVGVAEECSEGGWAEMFRRVLNNYMGVLFGQNIPFWFGDS